MMRKLRATGKNFVRRLVGFAPKLRLIPPPMQRLNKVSVIFRVYNEATWVKAGLLSLRNFADEILIGDTGSTDGTLEIIKEYMDKHPNLDIKLYDCKGLTFTEENNFLHQKTRYRWIMRWDGDHIAYTTGKNSILNLKKILLSLDPTYYYGILLSYPCLYLDPFHVLKTLFNTEIWVYTYDKNVWYINDEKDVHNKFWFPLYFRIIKLKDNYVLHCNIKSKERILKRFYWRKWDYSDRTLYPTLKDYALAHIKKDFNTDDFSVACNELLKKHFDSVMKYPKKKLGEYPELFREILENPPYRLIYDKNGKIIKRSDF